VAAGSVTFEKRGATFILVARRVEGDVRTVLDWRGALVLGAAVGAIVGLFGLRRRK